MNRQQKEDVVAQLKAAINKTPVVLVTDFKGMRVASLSNLRRKIRDAGGEYQVAKNTLIRLAVKDSPVEQVGEFLSGNNALAISHGDPAVLAKALIDFAKTDDKFKVKGGAMSGRALSFDQVKAIASLPSREALLGSLFGTMNAVPTGFVRVLAAVPQKLLYALTAIKDQKEAPAA